ncbi:MAG: oligosaccharide flippase family protein [Anaerohalosphaeraceae bacterium]|nr:oligosaccharide flippase family protein [Anaerohalosphaeraceae bacterium]
MKELPQDSVLKRIFQNSGKLLTATVLAGLGGLASLALTGRALGAEKLGVLALIQAYIFLIDRLLNFQSWQAVIKYGAQANRENDKNNFKSLIKFTLALDFSTAIAGTIAAAGLVYLVAMFRDWPSEVVYITIIYSVTILFNVRGTPTGILRLFNKFGLIGLATVAGSVFKLFFVVIAFFVTDKLWVFAAIWMGSHIFESLLVFVSGWRQLARQGYSRILKTDTRGITKRHSGIWKFVLSTNLEQSIQLASVEADVLVVGAILGTATTGIYKIARQFAWILASFIGPISQAVYPELAHLAAGKHFSDLKRIMAKTSLIVGTMSLAIWVAFVFFGKWFLAITAGAEYIQAYSVMIILMFTFVIRGFASCLQLGLLALGRAGKVLQVQIISFVIFLPILYILLVSIGLVGAAISQIIYFVVYSLLMLLFFSNKFQAALWNK